MHLNMCDVRDQSSNGCIKAKILSFFKENMGIFGKIGPAKAGRIDF